jgi:hypothetical protein
MISTDAPRILQSPVGRFVRQGANVTFTADIVGLAPFDCQWLKDGAPINGANSAAFNISSVKLADAGLYSVVVGNSAGSATSSAATLRVQTAPPAVNVNLVHSEAVQYVDLGAAPDTGTVWNGVTEQMLIDSGTREFSLTDSDGVATELRFFSGSFGEPNSGGFGDNGGGNALQATYWHVGGGKVSPEFGLRGLDANKTYDLYVYGMATDFGVGWGEAYTLIGTGTKTLDPIPDTGWPVEGEDYVVFRGVTGAQEARLTSGMAGGYFSTVTGLQVIEAEPNIVLLIQRSGPDEISISWTGGGTLQESDSLTGQWQPVSSSANPYRTQTSAVQKFYRVKK